MHVDGPQVSNIATPLTASGHHNHNYTFQIEFCSETPIPGDILVKITLLYSPLKEHH